MMSSHPGPVGPPPDCTVYALARRPVLDLDSFARRVAVHPDLLRRLATLNVIPVRRRDPDGTLWFGPEQAAVMARIQRLRAGLGLSYSAIGVVLALLEHIDRLEAVAASTGHHDERYRQAGRRPVDPPPS